ncbi:MAG: hypothetical protein ABR505_04705 [Actinomycetota bacterium]
MTTTKESAASSPSWLQRADRSLRDEFRRAQERHPKVASIYRAVVQRAILVIALLAVVRGLWDGVDIPLFDFDRFLRAGDRMLSSDWQLTYSEPRLQAGPLLLLLYGVSLRLADLVGLAAQFSLSVIVQVLVAVGVVLCVRALRADRGAAAAPGIEFFAGLAAVLGGLTWEAYASAHPSEALIPLLWLPAALLARRGRTTTAALLIGLSATLKLWGILGLPVLLLAPNLLQAGWAIALAGVVAIVPYAPFLLFGETATFGYAWGIQPDSPLGLFFREREGFTWAMRIGQSAMVLAGGGVFAWRRRSAWTSIWAAPLVLLAIRFLTEPLDYHYYWLAPGILVLVAACAHLDPRPTWLRVPIAGAFYAILASFFFVELQLESVWWIVLSLALLLVAHRATQEEREAGDAAAGSHT